MALVALAFLDADACHRYSSTIRLVTVSPRPVPLMPLVVWKGSKICAWRLARDARAVVDHVDADYGLARPGDGQVSRWVQHVARFDRDRARMRLHGLHGVHHEIHDRLMQQVRVDHHRRHLGVGIDDERDLAGVALVGEQRGALFDEIADAGELGVFRRAEARIREHVAGVRAMIRSMFRLRIAHPPRAILRSSFLSPISTTSAPPRSPWRMFLMEWLSTATVSPVASQALGLDFLGVRVGVGEGQPRVAGQGVEERELLGREGVVGDGRVHVDRAENLAAELDEVTKSRADGENCLRCRPCLARSFMAFEERTPSACLRAWLRMVREMWMRASFLSKGLCGA